MFRRTTRPESASPGPETDAASGEASAGPSGDQRASKTGGKGRPTPTRREAEAAARERARMGMDKKQAQKVLRERRADDAARVRRGMREGDERYLMARDKGPVRRFARDYVDHRRSVSEFLLPVLVLLTALMLSGNQKLAGIANGIWMALVLIIIVEMTLLNVRLSREMRSRFAEREDTRGWRFYAVMRAVQLRPLRMPKPQVKPGQKLSRTYR